MIGGGTGPADGTNATTCTPGPWNLRMMLKAAEEYPMNLGFLGKGNCSDEAPLIEQVKAGAMGLKIHEDWGATPAVINHCLNVADEFDVQVAIHTDTLNEADASKIRLRPSAEEPSIRTTPREPAAATHRTSSALLLHRTFCLPPRIRQCLTLSTHLMSILTC